MTSHHGRLYALAASILLFFVAWAVVAAHPWAAPAAASSGSSVRVVTLPPLVITRTS